MKLLVWWRTGKWQQANDGFKLRNLQRRGEVPNHEADSLMTTESWSWSLNTDRWWVWWGTGVAADERDSGAPPTGISWPPQRGLDSERMEKHQNSRRPWQRWQCCWLIIIIFPFQRPQWDTGEMVVALAAGQSLGEADCQHLYSFDFSSSSIFEFGHFCKHVLNYVLD